MPRAAAAARPRRRVETQALTRRRLLDAARRVFVRRGYHGTTLDAVAAEAGFTKGAVYAGFDGKADLFLALYAERVEARAAALETLLATVPAAERARAVARSWAEALRRDRGWHLVLMEFWLVAARDPALRRRFAALHGRMRTTIAAAVTRTRDASGTPMPLEPELVATAQMAVGNGFALEGFLEPALADGSGYERLAAVLDRALGLVPGAPAASRGSAR